MKFVYEVTVSIHTISLEPGGEETHYESKSHLSAESLVVAAQKAAPRQKTLRFGGDNDGTIQHIRVVAIRELGALEPDD